MPDPIPTPLDGDPTPAPAPADPPADPPAGGDPSPAPADPPADPPAGGDPSPAPADPQGDSPETPETPATPWYQGDQLPADWREQLAGEDTKTLNMLKRVDGINTLVKNYVEAQETIRKGGTPAQDAPPEDPTKLAEWRQERGVPEAPDKYEFKLEDGLVMSDVDREDMAPLLETFHGMNLNNEQVNQTINTFYKIQSAQADRLVSQDRLDQTEAKRMLEENWGGDFETNLNLVQSLIQQEFPADLLDEFKGARLGNGKALFNDPGVMAAFAKIARLVNPTATLVPSGHNPMQTLDQQIKELEGRMGEPGWHKDKAANDKYMQLIQARDTLRARQGG